MTGFLKKHALLFLAAVAGAAAFSMLLGKITPDASLDLRYSRPEIMERANTYLQGLGYSLAGYQQDAWVGFESNTEMYLQTRLGLDQSNALIRSDTIPAHHWYVNWYDRKVSRSQSLESFELWMTPGGRVLGFEHVIQDSITKPSVLPDEARAMAEKFVTAQGINLSLYKLKTWSDTKQEHRTDYHFVWSKIDTLEEQGFWVMVQGNEVGGFRLTFTPGGEFQRVYSSNYTTMTFVVTASFAALFLMFFYIVIFFLKKYHEGEVGTRTAVMVFIGLFLTSILYTINNYPVVGSGTRIGDLNAFNVRLVMFGMDIFIAQVFFGVLVFAAWAVGESASRSIWPAKLTAVDSALFRRFFTLDIGEGILRGYGLGLAILGLFAVTTYGLLHAAGVYLHSNGPAGIPESYIPAAQPVLLGIAGAVTCEIIFRLFFLSLFRERFKRRWLILVGSALVWTFTSYTLWELPFGQPHLGMYYAEMFLFGLVFGALFLRYDLITTMSANFVIITLQNSICLFSSTGPAFKAVHWEIIALLAVPVVIAVLGLIKRQRFEFTPDTMPQHIKRISERERMARELEIARSVQMSLLPKANPHAEGYDIAGTCIPALEVGGDYYDFVGLGSAKIGIAIGDVSGKGVPAAIYMTLTKGILQSHAEDNISPKSVLSKVNSLMYRTIERNSFVSMFYAILDLRQRTIRFARAGQCPVILAQSAEGAGAFLTPKGMALGLEMGKVFDAVLEEEEVCLQPGEVMVFYTDGFTEAMNEREEEFGEGRLLESVARHRHKPAAELIRCICDDVAAFTGDVPRHDDMTMVVVKVS